MLINTKNPKGQAENPDFRSSKVGGCQCHEPEFQRPLCSKTSWKGWQGWQGHWASWKHRFISVSMKFQSVLVESCLAFNCIIIHAAPRQGPPAPRSQGVINASGFVWSVMCLCFYSRRFVPHLYRYKYVRSVYLQLINIRLKGCVSWNFKLSLCVLL